MHISIEDLYPDASEEQLKVAERRLDSYLRIVLSIAKSKQEQLLDEARSRVQDDS